MAYSALVRRLLISCPGDVPISDLTVVQRAITRWNGIYGEGFGAVVVPISWGDHAAAEFGNPPQDLLNKQLVDRCDICIALFANRLGTPTAKAESGTAEEVMLLGENGRYVGILHSRRPIDLSTIDLGQAGKLEEYLAEVRKNALVLEYGSDDELSQRVDAILAAAISRDQGRADLQLQEAEARRAGAEVWPHVDSAEETIPIAGGRTLARRNWYLVLKNTGDEAACDVRVTIELPDGQNGLWRVLSGSTDGDHVVRVLAPHSEIRFELILAAEDPIQVECVVSWTDSRGRQENSATIRRS